ncbi:alpha-elapitoxin-Al2a-like [Corythoichthys intestinalis]|uniref:alpha-elapitoxin-Al2a-like n=1 Tax=Corythoichthys intestinalis TaxID=161448 RepID=UPI0025A5A22C|nr:alpha-elapitoxin-Al2a-like [Corythoichthys intestinalis]
MKTVLAALLVFVLVGQGEALRCYCGGMRIENCPPESDACISGIFNPPMTPGYVKGCYTKHGCDYLRRFATVSCCDTDLCNE